MKLSPIVIMLPLLLLAGCQQATWIKPIQPQTAPPNNPDINWKKRLPALVNINSWAFSGRTVITQEKEGVNANINWQQNRNAYSINLTGPFSQGGVELRGDGTAVIMTTSEGEQYAASSPESLLKKYMNLEMPVSALRYWLRGLPYSELSIDEMALNELGQLTELDQEGWNIRFKRYIPYQDYTMPGKIFIRHGDFSMRLVINDWSDV
jgi:outer membrane lipoprotein LolB